MVQTLPPFLKGQQGSCGMLEGLWAQAGLQGRGSGRPSLCTNLLSPLAESAPGSRPDSSPTFSLYRCRNPAVLGEHTVGQVQRWG